MIVEAPIFFVSVRYAPEKYMLGLKYRKKKEVQTWDVIQLEGLRDL